MPPLLAINTTSPTAQVPNRENRDSCDVYTSICTSSMSSSARIAAVVLRDAMRGLTRPGWHMNTLLGVHKTCKCSHDTSFIKDVSKKGAFKMWFAYFLSALCRARSNSPDTRVERIPTLSAATSGISETCFRSYGVALTIRGSTIRGVARARRFFIYAIQKYNYWMDINANTAALTL